ncbi:AMP-binding protein [Streptomyces sp. Marseille-Q5077]|uniref:AMP-binding protein n=1 Tax=Streptomyces sp. Marseille-Q5077 TaxID=3418995 RepID=UPI003CFD93EF
MRANQLAHHLRSLGVVEGALVGVCLERGLDLVPSLLGVEGGCGLSAVGSGFPAERLGFVLGDAGARGGGDVRRAGAGAGRGLRR